ncbi:hypothetical protein [Qipengyuania flava]|uniref:hypothetical protein n=1 Tax=Qipengyuania flava TaxID=192812 RepID=UPI001C62F15C|nr:hypothetical protein [Qipengyuania flava]QYJ06512.1 hypothetical protein KUV82_10590 [Qipengyuania flava]
MATDRSALAQQSLERLAEVGGDITQPVLEAYYREHPGARESFVHHGLGETAKLEGRMVAECLYLLLTWVEDPAAARIDHGSAIVHHNDTMHIPPHWYLGMVDAALEVLLATLPADAEAERELWLDVRGEFAEFVQSLRAEFVHSDGGAPLPAFPVAKM